MIETTTRVDDVVSLARQIAPLLNAAGADSRREGRLDPRVVDSLISLGLVKMFVPRSLGGFEAPVSQGCAAIEELTRADAPAGWNAMAVSAFLGSTSAYLPDDGAADLFDREDWMRVCGLLVPNGKVRAERAPGGFIFSGRSQFASGSRLATHFVFAANVYENGAPVRDADGNPELVVGLLPRASVTLAGNWNVDGLESTESVDYEADSVLVNASHTFPMSRFAEAPMRGTALAMGVMAYGSAMHGAVALGIGQRLLEEISALAPRRGRPGAPTIADRELFNHQLATAEIKLSAARNLFYTEVEAAEQLAEETGDHVPVSHARRIMAIVSHMHDIGLECADIAYSWGGSASFRDNSAISRYTRDMNVARSHVQADRANLAAAGPDTRARLAASRALLTGTAQTSVDSVR